MKEKKPIEVGMKVEFWSGSTKRVGRVAAKSRHDVPECYEVEVDPVVGYTVHRRQITKVWRKKPKPVAREIWVNEYKGGCLGPAYLSKNKALDSAEKDLLYVGTLCFREVLSKGGAK